MVRFNEVVNMSNIHIKGEGLALPDEIHLEMEAASWAIGF